MYSPKKFVFVVKLILLLFGYGIIQTDIVQATSSSDPSAPVGVTPTQVAGNPALCSGGFRIDPPNAGTYALDDLGNNVVVTISEAAGGQVFSWQVSDGIVIDQVVAKGGSGGANIYDYTTIDPNPSSDGSLHSPLNPSGEYADLSHIDFCYHYQLTVAKTADTSYTRTFLWDITKTVSPETLELFAGDSGEVAYTVAVAQTGFEDSNWAAQGEISIANDTPFAAIIESVNDVISDYGSVAVDCGVTFPYQLLSKSTLTCSYSTSLPDGVDRVNSATVVTSGAVEGDTATAAVEFGDPTTLVNDTINVDDTNGEIWTFSESGSVTYTQSFTCNTDAGTHDNTATIRETTQSDSAEVLINCYELTVTQSADTTFTRTWAWQIAKSGDQDALTLSTGQIFPVNYAVAVTANETDSEWMVTGTIIVTNPAPIDALLTTITDLIAPDITATVICPSLTVPASGQLECTYRALLTDAETRLNTASAILQNYTYAADGTATAAGTTNFTNSTSFTFGGPTIEIDECIAVTDDQAGALGEACAELGNQSQTFAYSLELQYDTCGNYNFINRATYAANDSATTGESSHTVTVTVPCAGGCTLTQGYWKTHSAYGPAPYDDTWALIGEDAAFYYSGQGYYTVLWTPPAGNVYYNLAHQYIAATLNVLNSAGDSSIATTLAAAESLLNDPTNTPAKIAALKGKDKKPWTDLAATLDQYNNGLIGPGHCSEVIDSSRGRSGPETTVMNIYLPTIVNR